MSAPLSTHTQEHTGTHLRSIFLPAPLSSVPANEERANEGQWGDEAAGGCGSEVAKGKDRARDKEASLRGKQTEDRDAYVKCTKHKGA